MDIFVLILVNEKVTYKSFAVFPEQPCKPAVSYSKLEGGEFGVVWCQSPILCGITDLKKKKPTE